MNDPYAINSKELKARVDAMEATGQQGAGQGGSSLQQLKITLAQRLAFPFSAFISVILALPLAATIGQRGKNLGLGLGIGLAVMMLFIYYVLLAVFSAIGKNGAMNPYLAAWVPNIIMGLAGAFMFRRVER